MPLVCPHALGALVLCLGLAAPVAAQVFVFEDDEGRLHFSDVPRHRGYRVLENSVEAARGRDLVARREVATGAWDGVIARASRAYGVSPGLVKAVVHVESLFDLYAVSHKGAQGLMQLMPHTARKLGVEDPFDPWQNVDAGTKFLRYLMRRFEGDTELALAAYNAGETVVQRFGGIPPYRETERYVRRVMSLARRYHADFH